MKHKHRFLAYLLLILALGISFYFARQIPGWENWVNPTYVRDYLQSWGVWGYLVFIILLLLSVPLPIPSAPVVLGGGYVYGIWIGTILGMIGTILGGVISFYLVRYLGEPLLEKLVDKHHIIHFNHLFKKYETKAALISYAIPIFPSDVVSLLLGLTRINTWTFLFLVTVGNIPRTLIINSLGSDLATGFTFQSIFILIFSTIFLLIALFREKIKLLLFKELKYVKVEAEKAERFVEKEVEEEEVNLGMKQKINQNKNKIRKNKK